MTQESTFKLMKYIPSLLVYCFGIWLFFTKTSPSWDAEISIRDRACIFSSSYRAKLEPNLRKLWEQEHAPTFIITGFTKEYVSLIHNETAFVVSRNLKKDTYDLFQAHGGGKGKPIFRLIGSFTTVDEMSQKLLYVVDDHQKSAHSKNKIDKDLTNALPALAAALVIICLLVGVLPLLHCTYKWISQKFLLP